VPTLTDAAISKAKLNVKKSLLSMETSEVEYLGRMLFHTTTETYDRDFSEIPKYMKKQFKLTGNFEKDEVQLQYLSETAIDNLPHLRNLQKERVKAAGKKLKKSELPSTKLQPLKPIHAMATQKILGDRVLSDVVGDQADDTNVAALSTDITLEAQKLVEATNNAILKNPNIQPLSYQQALEQALYKIKLERVDNDGEYMNKEQASEFKKKWMHRANLRLRTMNKYKGFSKEQMNNQLDNLFYDTNTRELFR